ncbi:MAG: carbon storage regulator [Spirochaetes bacterium GWF1_51_8]|nr:MAG: carbon storage regulator [Spirochaetes bacterium GWF1_51_8]
MLVLSRKENESIIINDDIIIKIVSLKPDQVKLGIVAPKEVKIYRMEIYDEIQKENQAAAMTAPKLDALKDVIKQKKE